MTAKIFQKKKEALLATLAKTPSSSDLLETAGKEKVEIKQESDVMQPLNNVKQLTSQIETHKELLEKSGSEFQST